MKKAILYFSSIALCVSCNTKTITKEEVTSESVSEEITDTIFSDSIVEKKKPVDLKVSFDTIDFISYFSEGFSIKSNEVIPVSIVAKSTKMYPMAVEDTYCSQAYFLKIKLDDEHEIIVDGSQIYGLTEETEKYSVEFRNKSYCLFTITPFKIGGFFDGELSGCSDYNTLILEDIAERRWHLLKNKRTDSDAYYAEQYNINYFYANSDDGVNEWISSAEGREGYILVHIGGHYQDGNFTYDLHVKEREGSFYWQMMNRSPITYD